MRGRFFGLGHRTLQHPWMRRTGVETLATAATDTAATAVEPLHDPVMAPRDEAVLLLTAVAEIEHALMVQYLFAAYSLRIIEGDANAARIANIQSTLLQIAREEMGHLMTVQNLLHLLGGPLNFNREHSPFASEIYPFRFKLEPLSLDSLAKYVVAESPLKLPDHFTAADLEIFERIKIAAQRSNDGVAVNHVGPFFHRLKDLFSDETAGVQAEDFRIDSAPLQGKFADWGYEPKQLGQGQKLIIESFQATSVAELRQAAVKAVEEIGLQGEASDAAPAAPTESESHFERFFDIYKLVEPMLNAGAVLTWPVTENPNTTPAAAPAPDGAMKMVEMVVEAHEARGRITHPRTLGWAHLFNLRYRLLLGYLSHFLRSNRSLYIAQEGPALGDRTERGLLLIWTFNEMRRLKKIADKLVRLPRDIAATGVNAGPPFELPYTLNLPDREEDRWRSHLDVSRASVRLIRTTLQPGNETDAADGFLEDLATLDEQDQTILRALAEGEGVPEGSLPTDFQKVVTILEESVRGFDVLSRTHGNFWANKSRDEFVSMRPPAGAGDHIIQRDGDSFNADSSPLIQRIESSNPRARMPLLRPPIPPERVSYLRDWIETRCPDNQPAGRPGMTRERTPAAEQVAAPAPGGPLGFEAHIKKLFREDPDRSFMLAFGFDLHRFEDVRDNAARILERLMDGSMPCDGSWSAEKIQVFRQWIDEGTKP